MMFQHCLNRVAAVSALLLASGLARSEPATDESLRQYFKISGQEAAAIENYNRILPALRALAKDVPEDLWLELTRTDKLISWLIPIYRKHFTEEDIQDLIAFHRTPTGSKVAAQASTIQREVLEQGALQARMTITNYQVQKGRFKVDPPKPTN
jgi:hypothetical protein